MIFGIPVAILFGILTIILLFITAILGVLTYKFHKNTFKAHLFFAVITIIFAVIHAILAFLLYSGLFVI